MATTNTTRNPWAKAILSFFAELTTPESRQWHLQKLQTTATLAQTIALHGFTTAKHLLRDSKPVAIAAAVAEAEGATVQAEVVEAQDLPVPDGWEAIEADDVAVAQPEQAEVGYEAIAPEPDLSAAAEDDSEAVDGLDDDDTELRPWTNDEAEAESLSRVEDEDEKPFALHQWDEYLPLEDEAAGNGA